MKDLDLLGCILCWQVSQWRTQSPEGKHSDTATALATVLHLPGYRGQWISLRSLLKHIRVQRLLLVRERILSNMISRNIPQKFDLRGINSWFSQTRNWALTMSFLLDWGQRKISMRYLKSLNTGWGEFPCYILHFLFCKKRGGVSPWICFFNNIPFTLHSLSYRKKQWAGVMMR